MKFKIRTALSMLLMLALLLGASTSVFAVEGPTIEVEAFDPFYPDAPVPPVPEIPTATIINSGYIGDSENEWNGTNVVWTLDNAGTLTISGTGELVGGGGIHPWPNDIKTLVIEDGITTIGGNRFCECKELTSVSIGDSVKIINSGAFDTCTSLESIVIPNSVTEISPYAFSRCANLKNITFSPGISKIVWGAFYDTNLTDIYFNGSKKQWNDIEIEYTGNDTILYATKHFTNTTTQPPIVGLTTQKVLLNGNPVNAEVYNIDGSNYFKLRDVAAMLNDTVAKFEVGYDNDTGTVTVTKGMPYTFVGGELSPGADKSNTCVESTNTILIDGREVTLTAYLIGGNNFFKLRELGGALGFGVGYDAENNAVTMGAQPSQSQSGFYAEGQQPSGNPYQNSEGNWLYPSGYNPSPDDDAMRQLMETPVEQIDPVWEPIPEGSTSTGDMYSEKRNQLALDWANRHLPEHATQNPYFIDAGKPGIADEDLDKPLSELYPDLDPYWW